MLSIMNIDKDAVLSLPEDGVPEQLLTVEEEDDLDDTHKNVRFECRRSDQDGNCW